MDEIMKLVCISDFQIFPFQLFYVFTYLESQVLFDFLQPKRFAKNKLEEKILSNVYDCCQPSEIIEK